ncbi:hypothetical protein FKP32DRAFT_1100872 [Trametes sanguinea]|nr:hypothetical protein FKP32DRAFT_1100872 [Trametes sanguinea]
MTTLETAMPRMDTAGLRDFFDRLATGDYRALAKELNIVPKSLARPPTSPAPSEDLSTPAGELSFDSFDSQTFEPTVEGLEAAVALLRGPTSPISPHRPLGATEDDEQFQFTFRLMIHKLYSLHDFAKMADDVVRASQERFRPLPAELTSRRASFSRAYADPSSDAESFVSAGSLASPSEPTLPSSPSLWSLNLDRTSEFEKDEEMLVEARVLKKRCVGRKLSVVDSDAGAADGAEGDGPAWVYDSAVASVESPVAPSSYAAFLEGMPPMSPAAESPSRYGYSGAYDEPDPSSRKRRFSLLAARGF